MKIRCFEENDIKPIYELLKNELGYEVDYSLFVLRVQEMIKNNYLIYVACIENKVVGFIGIEVSYVFELPKQIMRVNALAIDKNYQNKNPRLHLFVLFQYCTKRFPCRNRSASVQCLPYKQAFHSLTYRFYIDIHLR